ncbi:MAG: ADP-glyceromanno-heptose 6-epimerase [Candidatus Hydrogenedentota bacterium]|nr:MAG: ADP-glyceromanno-heptose 6-epimerase [Candidatus Hydrogenedentota bacterium]
MYIVTGGAGFIGSALVWKLNSIGITDILIVDALGSSDKWKNLSSLRFTDFLHKDDFLQMLISETMPDGIEGVFHLGACSSTTERNADYLLQNNYRYSCLLARWTLSKKIRFLYASSAATYGDGSSGYSDDHDSLFQLRPQNIYGYSKHLFDLFALRRGYLDHCAGIKFFNVYGPNEYHKGDMSSVIYKAFHQIHETGTLKLFRSYRDDFADGEQKRDFIFVKDCVEVLWWLFEHKNANGLFNLGTGKARTWNDLAAAVFSAMKRPVKIEYIDMPESIRDRYQYFTEARMEKLRQAGYTEPFTSLEDGVEDYVRNYLARGPAHLG